MAGLSKRLKGVADLVSLGHTAADVGCDHGYVSIYLIRQKLAEHVIAMDVNEGPLKRARENVEREGLATYIDTRLSDGLKQLLENEAETVICAGMGGRLMVRILAEGNIVQKGVKELILQPQSEIALVRHFLYEQGFVICRENMILDEGKYYQMMRCRPRTMAEHGCADALGLSDVEANYGPLLLREQNPVLGQFLHLEKAKYQDLLERVLRENPSKCEPLRIKCLLIEKALAGYKNEM